MGRIRKPYTLIKRGSVYYYRTYDAEGYRTTAKSTGCTSKTAAVKYCENLYLKGTLNVTRATFKDYAEGFFDHDSPYVIAMGRKLAVNTTYHYKCDLNSRLIPRFGNMPLADIKYSDLITYQSELLKTLSQQRVSVIFCALSHIFKVAYRDRIITYNPMQNFEYNNDRQSQSVRNPYLRNEVIAMYHQLHNYKNTWLLLALTGMRVSEAIGITEDNFIEVHGQLSIDLQNQWDCRISTYIPCKSQSARIIPVIPEIKELLLPYLPYATLRSAVKVAATELNITDKSIHSLRHFAITDMKFNGCNPYHVESVVGHKFPGMESVYTHVRIEDMHDILDWQRKLYDDCIR